MVRRHNNHWTCLLCACVVGTAHCVDQNRRESRTTNSTLNPLHHMTSHDHSLYPPHLTYCRKLLLINNYKTTSGYSSSLSNVYLDFAGSNFLKVLSGGAVLLSMLSLSPPVTSVCTAAGGTVVGCKKDTRKM